MKFRPSTLGVRPSGRRRTGRLLGVALVAFALLVGAAVPAAAAELMRVTFIRHGESAGNASGNIDTSTPGPVLTPKGQQQAQAVADKLAVNNYDGIYASTMVRTQLTAQPMSQRLGLPIQVLPGLQEIEAGAFEGTPESQASSGYGLFPVAWALQGNRDLRIPGSIDGNEFDARMDGALQDIYDNGDRNAVVFSHGGAIMFWTMMNASNLTAAQKLDLLRNYPLKNTDYVVVEGNPEDGWTLVDWNGKQFAPEPTLEAEVKLQMRTLQRQLAASFKKVTDAFATGDPATVVAAVNQGVSEATHSITKFTGAVSNKVFKELDKLKAATTPAVQDVAVQNASARTANVATVDSVTTDVARTAPAETTPAVGEQQKSVSVQKSAKKKSEPADETTSPSKSPSKKEATDEAKDETSSNGATDLKDGNKAEPGTTAEPKKDTDSGDKVSVAVSADSTADAGSTSAGSSTSAGGSTSAGASE